MSRTLYHYILNTMADWETGYVLSELGSGRFFQDPSDRFNLILCSESLNPITTMGGVQMRPDMLISDIMPKPGDLLILPGADIWMSPSQTQILSLVRSLLDTEITIAAICGGTMGLANAGLLNNHLHTSNDLQVLLNFCPGYGGQSHYVTEPAVTDRNLITASGLAPVDFARHVFRHLGVMKEKTLEAWYQLNMTRNGEYYYQLMESLS